MKMVDSLTEPAARRLLEDMLFTQGVDSEEFHGHYVARLSFLLSKRRRR
jgi:hypothetical protein